MKAKTSKRKTSKRKISKRKTSKRKTKSKISSIKDFKEILSEEDKYLLKNNLLINQDNINLINKEIIFNSGLFLKNRS